MEKNISPIRNAIRALPKGASFLVAVSGGIDSVVLLHALNEEKRFIRAKTIEVAHVDHGLRKSSKRDAAFVKKLSKVLGLGCTVKKLTPRKTQSGGTELWGRQERYKFFNAVRKKKKIDYVLTAHQANDEAETFLMRLIFDKDPRGGVAAFDAERKVVRPLIAVTRKEIVAYAKTMKLVWAEDPTNAQNDFLRNKVRNKVLPHIEKSLKTNVVVSLAHRAQVQKEDWEGYRSAIRYLVLPVEKYSALSRDWLRALKEVLKDKTPGLRARIIEHLFLPILEFALGIERAKQLDQFIQGSGKYLDLGQGITIVKKEGALSFSRR